jgi:lysophospholipase L1-like esterase
MYTSSGMSVCARRVALVLASAFLLASVTALGCLHWQRVEASAHGDPPGPPVPSLESMFDYRPTLLVVGDSFAGGTGDPTFRPYPYLLGDRLGWNLTVDAQGGTGFVKAATTGKSPGVPFIGRLARDGQLYNVDYVLIDGGRNDLGLLPTEVIPAADEYIRKVRDTWPKAKIVVILPSYVSAQEAANYPAVSQGLRRVAGEVDADVIDPVAEGWYRGRDLAPLFWNDRVHLNAVGNEYYASRIFADLKALGWTK